MVVLKPLLPLARDVATRAAAASTSSNSGRSQRRENLRRSVTGRSQASRLHVSQPKGSERDDRRRILAAKNVPRVEVYFFFAFLLEGVYLSTHFPCAAARTSRMCPS